jgi:hypothetical protein
VQFYNQAGEHLRTLRVPGGGISGICWEGSGLRLALAVDSHIFFTSMRHSYLWAYFADTLVYAFTKPERQEHCVMFWGTGSNERYAKYVKRVTHVSAAGNFCLLATKVGVGERDSSSSRWCLSMEQQCRARVKPATATPAVQATLSSAVPVIQHPVLDCCKAFTT